MIYRTHLEHLVTEHCNLKCANCSSGSPFLKEGLSDVNQIEKDVKTLGKYMRMDFIRFVGGEPTLHPELPKFFEIAKRSELLQKKVTCITNGLKLLNMPNEFWEHVDVIGLSVYAHSGINYHKVIEILHEQKDKNGVTFFIATEEDQQSKIEIIKDNYDINKKYVDHGTFKILDVYEEFSQTQAQDIFDGCLMKDICHSFLDGRYYRCTISTIKDKHYAAKGIDTGYNFKIQDSIPINDDFPEAWEKYTKSKILNINACRFCRGIQTDLAEPHRQLTKEELLNWVS